MFHSSLHLRKLVPSLTLVVVACGPKLEPADLVLHHGRVYTLDESGTKAQALAVRDGRIIAVGSDEEVEAYIGEDTDLEDLEGRVLLPGLTDAHTHLLWSATQLLDVDLYDATTLKEMLDAIEARAMDAPDEAWIRGVGWDRSIFEGTLNKAQLDEVVPDRPVYMEAADSHAAWVNSPALEAAGIHKDTPDPEGGTIERDGDGEPTGILQESALELVTDVMPPYSEAQIDEGLSAALLEANSFGLTSIMDANCEAWMLSGYRRFDDLGRLTLRVFCAVEVDPASDAEAVETVNALRDEFQGGRLEVNAAKFYLDGVIESETAVMLEPYEDGSNGVPVFSDEALHLQAIALDAEGYQLHAHTIGDGAVRQMLDALEAVVAANGERDRRPLLAHLEVIDPDDIGRFAELEAYADFQPLWAYPDEYITELTEPVIGEERSEWLYPLGAVAQAGGTLLAGSDWCVSSMNPWEGMEVAVTRQDPEDLEGEVLTPQHKVDLETILRAYTVNGARATFREEDLGSLEAGKLADLVVVDRDIMGIDPHDLSNVKVLATYLEGRLVYREGM